RANSSRRAHRRHAPRPSAAHTPVSPATASNAPAALPEPGGTRILRGVEILVDTRDASVADRDDHAYGNAEGLAAGLDAAHHVLLNEAARKEIAANLGVLERLEQRWKVRDAGDVLVARLRAAIVIAPYHSIGRIDRVEGLDVRILNRGHETIRQPPHRVNVRHACPPVVRRRLLAL